MEQRRQYYCVTCRLSGEDGECNGYPPECGRYVETNVICPNCLEFKGRGYPVSEFRFANLLSATDASGKAFFACPVCDESYFGLGEVMEHAIGNLKDALDDVDHLDCLVSSQEEEINRLRLIIADDKEK